MQKESIYQDVLRRQTKSIRVQKSQYRWRQNFYYYKCKNYVFFYKLNHILRYIDPSISIVVKNTSRTLLNMTLLKNDAFSSYSCKFSKTIQIIIVLKSLWSSSRNPTNVHNADIDNFTISSKFSCSKIPKFQKYYRQQKRSSNYISVYFISKSESVSKKI